MENKTEQCFCQSYYDDNNELQNCTCGKCGTKNKRAEWEREFDIFIKNNTDLLHTNGDSGWLEENKRDLVNIKSFIRQLLIDDRSKGKE